MNQSALAPAGLGALHIASLWWLLLGVCTVVFTIVAICLAIAIWRRRPEPAGTIDPHPSSDPTIQNFLFGVVGVIVLTLFGLLIADFLTGRKVLETGTPADPDAMRIKVTGHQWWWEVRYLDANPSRIVTTANEIHLPVGRTVLVELNSVDVIHSFWIPNLSGKKDMIPGHPTSTWMRAVRAGEFRGQCAEYCGLEHAYMDLHVVTEAPQKFDGWLNAQRALPPAPTEPLAQLGRRVFEQKTCATCHRIEGSSALGTVGPDLTHFASRPKLAGAVPNTHDNLASWITDPSRTKPGVLMPPHSLPPDELHALLAYLATLR